MNLNLHGKAAWFALAVLSVVGTVSALTLEEGFKAPPPDARPQVLYFMMNGNVTKEGITCDFEAIAKAGLGGMLMMDIASAHMPYGEVEFNTPEWFALMRHAHNEAKRLGLEMSMTTCSGWATAGGPWNVPSNTMKKVVYAETRLKGPATFRGKLPRTKEDNGFYDDIAVLAFPTQSGNLRLSRLENKTYVKRGPVNRDEGLRPATGRSCAWDTSAMGCAIVRRPVAARGSRWTSFPPPLLSSTRSNTRRDSARSLA